VNTILTRDLFKKRNQSGTRSRRAQGHCDVYRPHTWSRAGYAKPRKSYEL